MGKKLVIIDMQKDFIDGSLGSEAAIEAAKNVANNMVYLADGVDTTVCTLDTHKGNYLNTLEGQLLPIEHCKLNSEGWAISDIIYKALPNDVDFITKNTFGEIGRWDRAFGTVYGDSIDEIRIVGLCTDVCVISNALILRTKYPNTKITVFSDCCAGTTLKAHEAALTVMRSCQINTDTVKNLKDSIRLGGKNDLY